MLGDARIGGVHPCPWECAGRKGPFSETSDACSSKSAVKDIELFVVFHKSLVIDKATTLSSLYPAQMGGCPTRMLPSKNIAALRNLDFATTTGSPVAF